MFETDRGIEILYFRSICHKCGWKSNRIYQGMDRRHHVLANIEFDNHVCNSNNISATIDNTRYVGPVVQLVRTNRS